TAQEELLDLAVSAGTPRLRTRRFLVRRVPSHRRAVRYVCEAGAEGHAVGKPRKLPRCHSCEGRNPATVSAETLNPCVRRNDRVWRFNTHGAARICASGGKQ